MIFLGSRTTGRFAKMITPISIDVSTDKNNVLYVQECTGDWYVLTFESHEALAEAMKKLLYEGRTSCYCEYEYYNAKAYEYKEDQDREIDYKESYDDMEMDIER